MAETQLRSLRVSVEGDSTSYVAAMKEKMAADQQAVASSNAVGNAITQTDTKLSRAADGVERLKRQFVTGYAASQDFERGLATIGRGLDKGKLTADQAAVAVENLSRKYGQTATAASTVVSSNAALATAVSTANARITSQSTAVDELAASYRRLAAEARAAQAADNAQNSFNRSFGIAQPSSTSASASASVFMERFAQEEELLKRQQEIARLRSQQQGANFYNQTNALLGVNGNGTDARASAAVFEEAAREAESYAQKAALLRAQIDPVGASQARLNAELAEYALLANRAEISTEELAQAETLARTRHDQFVASMSRNSAGLRNAGSFQSSNIAAQFQDIGVTAAMGMSPLQIALQQGTQLSSVFDQMRQNGQSAASGLAAAFGSLISPMSLLTIGAVAATAAIIQYGGAWLSSGSNAEETLKRQRDLIDDATKKWAAALPALKAYNDELQRGKDLQGQREAVEAGISLTWAGAKSAVTDFNIEVSDTILKLQQAGTANEDINVLQSAWNSLRTRVEQNKATFEDVRAAQTTLFLEMNQSGIPITEQLRDVFSGLSAAIDEASGRSRRLAGDLDNVLTKTDEMREKMRPYGEALLKIQQTQHDLYNPSNIPAGVSVPIPTARPQNNFPAIDEEVQRTQSVYQQLAGTADQRIAQLRNEIAISGQATDVQARLRAEFEAEAQYRQQIAQSGGIVKPEEIAMLREKAALQAQLTQQASAQKLLQGQNDQIEQLRLEASLIGASAEERVRATAALQAEQQLRSQGISLISQEAQAYIANAQAMAQARLEIERQNAAFQSMQQTGTSALSSLITGTGSFKERLKSALDTTLQWVQQMTLVNPLSNSIFKTNLPTMADLFSGRPSVPGTTTTGMMTVTATTVMVNGGVAGGLLPGAQTQGGLPGLLGLSNGVRPDLTNSGVVNSPVLAAANQNAITGVVPQSVVDAGRGFTTFQMSDGSIVRRTGDFAWRNNNPGNIEAGAYAASQPGYIPGGGRFAAFQTFDQGQAARENLLFNSAAYRNLTLEQAINRYAPPSENNTASYLSSVSSASGISGSTLMRDITPAQRQAILAEQLRIEGNTPGQSTVLRGASTAQVDQNMQALANSTKAATTNVSGFGDTTKSVTTSLADVLGGTKTNPAVPAATGGLSPNYFPAAPQGQNYFPPAPTATASPFSLLKSIPIIGPFFSLFGFADGTDFAPGGLAMVGERGREIVNLPRGSQVIPNHRLGSIGNDNKPVTHKHEYSITVAGNGDKELMSRMRIAAEQAVSAGLSQYNNEVLPGRIEDIRRNPDMVG